MKTYLTEYNIDLSIAAAYAKSLRQHIELVQVVGKLLGVPQSLLHIHDLSKFDDIEFVGYAMSFYGNDRSKFNKAWLHHIHHNPHHWEHWIIPAGKILPMPEEYVLEMVADWLASERLNKGSWNMSAWLTNNLFNSNIKLHLDTRTFLFRILEDGLGYNLEYLPVTLTKNHLFKDVE